MAEKPIKFQMTLYAADVAAIAALGDALEAANVDVRGPDGTRSKAAVVRHALRAAAERAREDIIDRYHGALLDEDPMPR